MRIYRTIRAWLFVMTLTAAFPFFVLGQKLQSKSMTVCGREFAIGLSLEKSLAMITDAGDCVPTKIKTESTNASEYMLASKLQPSKILGELSFIKERLVTISKMWDADVHSETEYGRVLIGLLHKFEQEGHTLCKLSTFYSADPEVDSKEARLDCGAKKIQLDFLEYKGAKSIQITETLE